jgi:hypothetical protein
MTPLPAAEAFSALVGVLQHQLRDQTCHAVYLSHWNRGHTKVVAVDGRGEAVESTARSAHQQMAWASLERQAHSAYKAFQKACRRVPHLQPQATRMALTVTGPHRAQVAWEWGNLDFTQGLSKRDAPTFPLARAAQAIAAVETSGGTAEPVLLHNRRDNTAIGRVHWPAEGARGFIAALQPRGQQGIVGFQQAARFTRTEAKHGFHATTPGHVGQAFQTLLHSLQTAPDGIKGLHLEWSNDQIWPTLEVRGQRSDRRDHVSGVDAWAHPDAEGGTWLADCATALDAFHKAVLYQAPCMGRVLAGAPLVAGFLDRRYPYVSLFGMHILRQEDLCFLGYPPENLRAFHTTQGGAQHLDLPAPSAEAAAAFVRKRRDNGQIIEVWTAL